MKHRNLKRIFAMVFAFIMGFSVMPVFTQASEATGIRTVENVFQSGGTANYRIPNAIVTNSGAVWFFCNDRKESVADYTEIQQICAVSAPDGEHFGAVQYLLAEEGWRYVIGAPIYDAINDKIMLFYLLSPSSDAAKAEYQKFPQEEKGSNWYILESANGGKTWTTRWAGLKKSGKTQMLLPSTHGSNSGIQLKHGEHVGRLVMAAHYSRYDTHDLAINRNDDMAGRVCLLYSDDYGYTWNVSENSSDAGACEPALSELPDGTIYVNSRCAHGDNSRMIAYSYDGGKTISDCQKEYGLFQVASNGVKGSLTDFESPDASGQHILLYSCLLSPTEIRENLHIWISYDNGKTWPDIVTIRSGYAAYSSLYYNPKNQKIGILYEWGTKNAYNEGIRVEQFDWDWLMANKTKYVPLRVNTTPESVSPELIRNGLKAQFSPESLVGLANGSEVATWKDVSGSGNNAVSVSGATAPKLLADGRNGYSVLDFEDGASLNLKSIEGMNGNFTIFLTFKMDQTVAGEIMTILKNNGLYSFSFYVRAPSATLKTIHAYCTSSDIGRKIEIHSCNPYDYDYHTVALVWNGNSGEGMLTQFLDGSREDVKYCNGVYVERKTSSISVGDFLIGASSLDGKVAEMLVYDRALTDEEVAKNGLYLANKYDLTWSGVIDSSIPVDTDSNDDNTQATDDVDVQTDANGNSSRGCASNMMAVPAMTAAVAASMLCMAKTHRTRKHKKSKS